MDFRKLFKLPLTVDKTNMVQFYQQLATLISAGISLTRALRICNQQSSCKPLKIVLQVLHDAIDSGITFRDAMTRFPGVFSPFHIGLIDTAEKSGNFPGILTYLAAYEEKEMRLLQKIKAAMTYPVFVTIVAFIIVILLTRYMCPLLDSMTAMMGRDKVPVITKILIFVGKCSTDLRYVLGFLAVIFIGTFIVKKLSRTTKVSYLLGRFKFKIPTFGRVYKNIVVIRLCRVLSTLLYAGVPSVISIRILEKIADNTYFSEAIMKKIIWRVDEGKAFSLAFGESRFFPKVFLNMMVVGEQTGELPYVMNTMADLFEIDVNLFLQNISSILEPILIIVLGTATFFILLGAFLPIYALMSGF